VVKRNSREKFLTNRDGRMGAKIEAIRFNGVTPKGKVSV
jgi:hypothetical protein